MLTKQPSSSTLLSHVRHELRTSINVIIGYSEMLLEDLEITNHSSVLYNLQQIRECGIKLIYLIKTLLNDHQLEVYQLDLARLLTEQTVELQIQTITNSITQHCQQILNTTNNQDLVPDVKKIDRASQDLLAMTNNMVGMARR